MRRELRCGSLILFGIVLNGCADHSLAGPTIKPEPTGRFVYQPGEYDGSVPKYETEGEFPWPRVIRKDSWSAWDGAQAIVGSSMDYYGNRAREIHTMKIHGISPGSGGRGARAESTGGFWPSNYTHTTNPFFAYAGSSCGNRVDVSSEHTALTVAFVEIRGFTAAEDTQPGGTSSAQEACPTEERQEEAPSSGGYSDNCPTCLDEPEWCTVFYMYDKATGAILWYQVLWCE